MMRTGRVGYPWPSTADAASMAAMNTAACFTCSPPGFIYCILSLRSAENANLGEKNERKPASVQGRTELGHVLPPGRVVRIHHPAGQRDRPAGRVADEEGHHSDGGSARKGIAQFP